VSYHDLFILEDWLISGCRWGGDQLKPTGGLKDWTIMEDIEQIKVETLLLLGRYDQVQDVAVTPYFERLPRVKWVTLENSSHLGFLEERERYMEVLGLSCWLSITNSSVKSLWHGCFPGLTYNLELIPSLET
jgi:pimeloyl-ACP methyl ester carboxylesterase